MTDARDTASSGASAQHGSLWSRLPVVARAVVVGILVGMIAANVWPLLLLKLGMPTAAVAELLFLSLYVGWAMPVTQHFESHVEIIGAFLDGNVVTDSVGDLMRVRVG
jgi:hypothetical protein